MLHNNLGELHQLFSTFNRVWGAGGDASLSLKTVDGKVSAVLEVQLGPPTALRPGAPEAPQQAAGSWNQQPGQHCRQRRRGPGRQARDAARREAWKKRQQEARSSLRPPPPPPPLPAGDHTPAPGETPAATSAEPVEVPPPPPAPVQTPPPQDSSMSPPASGGISAPAAGYISPVGVIDDLGYETFTCCGMTFINWFGIDQHKKYSHPAFYIPDDRLLPYIADGFFADK